MCRMSQYTPVPHSGRRHYPVAHVDFCPFCEGSWYKADISMKYQRDPFHITKPWPFAARWADYDTYVRRLALYEKRPGTAKFANDEANHLRVPATNFRILDLPAELRNLVYAFYMADAQTTALIPCDCSKCCAQRAHCDDPRFPYQESKGFSHLTHPLLKPYGNTSEPALTRVNYQMRYETLPAWYGLWTIAIVFGRKNCLDRYKDSDSDEYRGRRTPVFLMAPEKLRMAGSLRFAVDTDNRVMDVASNNRLWAGIRRFAEQMMAADLVFTAMWLGVREFEDGSMYIPYHTDEPDNKDSWWGRRYWDMDTGLPAVAKEGTYELVVKTLRDKCRQLFGRADEEVDNEMVIRREDMEEDVALKARAEAAEVKRAEKDTAESFYLGDLEPGHYSAFMEDDHSHIGFKGLDEFRFEGEDTEAMLSDVPLPYWVTYKNAGTRKKVVRLEPVYESYWWDASVGQKELQMESVVSETLGYDVLPYSDAWTQSLQASIMTDSNAIAVHPLKIKVRRSRRR